VAESPEAGQAVAATPGREENGGRRRRRRRRRRGGRGEGVPATGTAEVTPDRHIFKVDGQGEARATGSSAPPEPPRAVARRPEKQAGPVAIEAPPPSLTVTEPKPKAARPTGTRRTKSAPAVKAQIASEPRAALPPAAEEKPKRTTARTRKPAATKAAEPETAAPKRRPRATAEGAAATAKPSKAKPRTVKSPVKAASAKKAPARKAATGAKKSGTRKKST
jgi:ribonuclease E